MIDLIYIAIIGVFAILIALALVTLFIRGNSLREQLAVFCEEVGRQQERIDSLRQDLADVAFDADLLEQEKSALEAQKNCMNQVEIAHLTNAANPEE